jgi:hypothetical protein
MNTSGSSPTPADRAAARRGRNRAIAEARDGGATWPQIAERFRLSERHARRAYAEHLREAGEVVNLDAGEALREVLNVHVWALGELRALASSADNSSARVGAIRSRVSVSHDLLRLLVAAGVVPPPEHAARMQLEVEKKRFAAAMIDVLEQRGIEYGDLEDDLARALRGLTVVV